MGLDLKDRSDKLERRTVEEKVLEYFYLTFFHTTLTKDILLTNN